MSDIVEDTVNDQTPSSCQPIYVSVVGRNFRDMRVAAGVDRCELFRDLISFYNEAQEDVTLGDDATEYEVVEAIHDNLDDFVRIFEC
jgi:hypothetical protein